MRCCNAALCATKPSKRATQVFVEKPLACVKKYARIKKVEVVRLVLVFNLVKWGVKMATIATICAVGTAIAAVMFSLWMLKNLFIGN